jgi:hypothetical protein
MSLEALMGLKQTGGFVYACVLFIRIITCPKFNYCNVYYSYTEAVLLGSAYIKLTQALLLKDKKFLKRI